MSKYFIQKNGVYASGVYWIGDVLDEGMELGMKLAQQDVDDYHEWRLYEYVEINTDTLITTPDCWWENTHFTSLPHKEICIFTKDKK